MDDDHVFALFSAKVLGVGLGVVLAGKLQDLVQFRSAGVLGDRGAGFVLDGVIDRKRVNPQVLDHVGPVKSVL